MQFFDDDADLRLVQERHVAVLGYGDDGPAHALSLRDTGVDIRVGLEDGSERSQVEAEGLRVVDPYQACEESDLVVLVAPRAQQPRLFAEAVEPNLLAGDALVFGSAEAVVDGAVTPPPDVDVCLVEPAAPGPIVREEYLDGRGVPVLVAAHQDATGAALALTLSYAKAMGGLRAGAIETTFSEAALARRFAQEAVFARGVVPLVLAGFETLTEAGCSPQVAYLQCVQQLEYVVDRLQRHGPAAAGLAADDVLGSGGHRRLRDALGEIRRGRERPLPAPEHAAEAVGRELRAAMPWLRADRTDRS